MTDRRIHQEYPQVQILRALKERCVEEDVEFRSLLMDQIVLTISEGQLGKYLGLIGRMSCGLLEMCNRFRGVWLIHSLYTSRRYRVSHWERLTANGHCLVAGGG